MPIQHYSVVLFSIVGCLGSPSTVCHSFNDALSYTLSQLGMPDLTLKAEQVRAISAVYGGSRFAMAREFAAFLVRS